MSKVEKTPSRDHKIELWDEDQWYVSWSWIGTGRTWRTYNKITDDRDYVERFAKRHNLGPIPEHEEDL